MASRCWGFHCYSRKGDFNGTRCPGYIFEELVFQVDGYSMSPQMIPMVSTRQRPAPSLTNANVEHFNISKGNSIRSIFINTAEGNLAIITNEANQFDGTLSVLRKGGRYCNIQGPVGAAIIDGVLQVGITDTNDTFTVNNRADVMLNRDMQIGGVSGANNNQLSVIEG